MKAIEMIEEGAPPPMTPNFEVVELGGYTHYSLEMRTYLASLPREHAERIVTEIEWRNRPRKIIKYRWGRP